jgi:hypothetical protein
MKESHVLRKDLAAYVKKVFKKSKVKEASEFGSGLCSIKMGNNYANANLPCCTNYTKLVYFLL